MITIQTKFGPREIDLTKVPQVSIDRAIRIGITNILRDSYASDKDDASRKASMESALAHFMEGTAPERGRSADPVAAEAKAIATAILKGQGRQARRGRLQGQARRVGRAREGCREGEGEREGARSACRRPRHLIAETGLRSWSYGKAT